MTKKLGIISDCHGNLPALIAVVQYLQEYGVDEIIHTGDVLNIGPDSKECLQYLLENGVTLLLGNHDLDYLLDRREHLPFSHVPAEHKAFVFDSVGKEYFDVISSFPLSVYRNIYGRKFAFMHYALLDNPTQRGYVFAPTVSEQTLRHFEEVFANVDADAVFFGHKHEPCNFSGRIEYVNVGAVACHQDDWARGVILTVNDDGSWSYERIAVPYDRQSFKERMTCCQLPYGKYLFDFYYDKTTKKMFDEAEE